MVYWPRDGGIVIRTKFKKDVEVYSLSSVTFVFYRELNSSSFILVRWVGWEGGWVAGLSKLITNSAQAEARARAELGKNVIFQDFPGDTKKSRKIQVFQEVW